MYDKWNAEILHFVCLNYVLKRKIHGLKLAEDVRAFPAFLEDMSVVPKPIPLI